MKKNFTHAITMMISIFISSLCSAHVCQSPANHCLELACEVEAVHDRSVQTFPVQSVTVFTPKAPYNNVNIIITAPAKVCVDQPFQIDYAIQVTKFTHISFWADLLPDADQGVPVTILDISNATIGDLDTDDESIAHQGGKGVWVFPKGLPGNSVQHLVITAKATSAGKIKFTSLLATNPPSYIETAGTLVSCTVPKINPATIHGVKNKPLTIYALDNVVADSEVSIVNVFQASYGTVVLNDDYTITYTPFPYFYGNDSFAYTVQDSAGNTASGSVSLVIEYAPSPAVLKN